MTAKQLIFANEYLRTGDITQSAIKAGYSAKTAKSIGSETLQKPEVRHYIESFRKQIQTETGVTVQRIVAELNKVAFSDISDLFEIIGDEVKIKKLTDLPANVRAMVAGITEEDTKHGKKRIIKLHSKLNALDMLMKHLGGYVTLNDIIDRLTPEQVEEISDKLLSKLQK
jgi:phage terminase small subunit